MASRAEAAANKFINDLNQEIRAEAAARGGGCQSVSGRSDLANRRRLRAEAAAPYIKK